jgi:hypothetical protein
MAFEERTGGCRVRARIRRMEIKRRCKSASLPSGSISQLAGVGCIRAYPRLLTPYARERASREMDKEEYIGS